MPAGVAREFHHRDLHAETNPEVRRAGFAGVADGGDLAFDAAVTETPGHKDAGRPAEVFFRAVVRFKAFGVDQHKVDTAIVRGAGVGQGFVNAFVGVLKFDVFADHGNADAFARTHHALDEFGPVLHLRRSRFELQRLADHSVEALLLQHERQFVNGMGDVARFDHRPLGDVAEEGKLFPDVIIERALGARDDDFGLQADFAQFRHTLLGRLGLQLAGRLDKRHKRDVDEHGVALASFEEVLADGLKKGQALDVTGRAADLDDGHIGPALRGEFADAGFDFVRDVRNNLDSFAEVITATFSGQHILINLSAGQVVTSPEHTTGEPLVVSEVEIGLRPVVEHINLAVLVRAHRARVDIEIRVEFSHGDPQAAAFEQCAERGGGKTFAE